MAQMIRRLRAMAFACVRAVSHSIRPPNAQSAFFLVGAICLAGCSFGPPNLAPFLSGNTDENRTYKVIFHVEGERLQSYRNPWMESADEAMRHQNFNFFFNPGFATRNLIVTTYFNYLILSPGIGFGWMREDFYLAAFVNSKFWIRDFEPSFQFGARFSENLNLSITYHVVEFNQWRRIEDPGPYLLYPKEIIATEKQDVLKISPGFSMFHERLTFSPSMMYALGSRALGASISLSWVVESDAKPR
jgi:hypothetical protein